MVLEKLSFIFSTKTHFQLSCLNSAHNRSMITIVRNHVKTETNEFLPETVDAEAAAAAAVILKKAAEAKFWLWCWPVL